MEQLGRNRASLGLGLVLVTGMLSGCAEGAGAADGVFNPPSVNHGPSDTDGSGTETDAVDSTTAVGSASYDTKRILVSTDGGASWSALVDCNVGPNAGLPFCVYQGGPRAANAWDEVQFDTGVFGGETGRLRIEYDTGDSCCSFEQGWFIDDATFRTCG